MYSYTYEHTNSYTHILKERETERGADIYRENMSALSCGTGGGELVQIITRGGRNLALTCEQASVRVQNHNTSSTADTHTHTVTDGRCCGDL